MYSVKSLTDQKMLSLSLFLPLSLFLSLSLSLSLRITSVKVIRYHTQLIIFFSMICNPLKKILHQYTGSSILMLYILLTHKIPPLPRAPAYQRTRHIVRVE